jgi:uncharacterized cupredoxin-like copper-binding protein
VALVLVLLSAGACGADRNGSADDEPARAANVAASSTSAPKRPVVARTHKSETDASAGSHMVELVCGRPGGDPGRLCEYSPSEVTASGTSVKMFLVNLQTEADLNGFVKAADLQHDLKILGADGQTLAQSERLAIGERATFTVDGLPPGSYEFYCTIPGHATQGMRGTLSIDA